MHPGATNSKGAISTARLEGDKEQVYYLNRERALGLSPGDGHKSGAVDFGREL